MVSLAMRALATIAAAILMLAACGGNKDELLHVVQQPLQTYGGEPLGSRDPLLVETSRPPTDGDGPLFEGARSPVGAPIIYSATGGPLPDAERARQVRIGANVTSLPDWKRPNPWNPLPNGIVISLGRTHDGARAARVEEYLRAHIDDVWESQGYENEPTTDTPGLASFSNLPVLRIAQGTNEEHTALALQALAIVNTALPWSKRILVGPNAPPLAQIDTIPDGQIFVDLAAKSDWTIQSSGTAAAEPDYSFEYDSTSERWEIKSMRAGHVWVDPNGFGTQAELVRVLLHELVHALGLRGHPYIDQFPEALMRNEWPSILATDNHIPDIDADGLLAIFTRLAPGTEPEDLSATRACSH